MYMCVFVYLRVCIFMCLRVFTCTLASLVCVYFFVHTRFARVCVFIAEMDVKQIREEISKIDSLLLQVDEDLKLKEDPIPDSVIESEYDVLLSSLSGVDALDAFTFFGLLQAFYAQDFLVLKCLCKVFSEVENVTSTQLEEVLLLVNKLDDLKSAEMLLRAAVDRIVLSPTEFLIIESCRLLKKLRLTHPGLIVLVDDVVNTKWSLEVYMEVATYSDYTPAPFFKKVCGLVEMNMVSIESAPWSIRTCWQAIEILSKNGRLVESLDLCALLMAIIEKALTHYSLPPTHDVDLHQLAISLSSNDLSNKQVWMLISEKISCVFQVSKTVSAFTKIGITIDGMFSNLLQFKKRVAEISSASDLEEFADHLILFGDKSTGTSVVKTIMERRDLYVPPTGDTKLLEKILLASVVASVDSGTVIPDSILLFRKFQNLMQLDTEHLGLLMHVLLPSTAPTDTPTSSFTLVSSVHEKIEKVLTILGFENTLQRGKDENGLSIDFAFLDQKIGLLIQPTEVYVISGSKARPVCAGLLALKANILVQRKGWRIVVLLPNMCIDDKSLMSLLTDSLKSVQFRNVFELTDSTDHAELHISQRIHDLRIKTVSLIEMAKFMFLVLKYCVVVNEFHFEISLNDQFLNLFFADFISTYLVRHHRTNISLYFVQNEFSHDAVLKLLDGINTTAVGVLGFGINSIQIALGSKFDKETLQAEWAKDSSKIVKIATLNSPEHRFAHISLI